MESTRWRAALGVALVAVAVHGPTVAFGLVELDDRDFVSDALASSRTVAAARGLTTVGATFASLASRSYMHAVDPAHLYYRPVVAASYLADALWTGARPFGYHATNVALHAAVSALALVWLRRLGFPSRAAALAALLFAVHPVAVSAVAWIPGRNDVILALAALGASIALQAPPSWRARAAHVACGAIALFTKETSLALPAVCAAQALLGLGEPGNDAAPGQGEPRGSRRKSLAGLGCAWVVMLTVRALAWRPPPGTVSGALESAVHHLAVVPRGLADIVMPVDPSLLATASDARPLAAITSVAGLAALFAVRRLRRRVLLFGMLAFVLWSLPPLATPGSLVLSERLYVPSLGIAVVVAEAVRAALAAFAPENVYAFAGPVVAVLGLESLGYARSFRDARSFARAAVEGAPDAPLAHECMARQAYREGDDDRALAEYAAALQLGAEFVVHNNVAVIWMKRGEWARAEAELRQEIAVDPGYAVAYGNLAVVLRHEGRDAEADAAEARAAELGR